MERLAPVIRQLESARLETFFAYLEDQLKDNGRNGTPLFQPQSRDAPGIDTEKAAQFRASLDVDIGKAQWRRAWGAFDPSRAFAGHIDLRAHPDHYTSHRAVLGMGVHRNHRGQGVGRSLVDFVISWALQNTAIEWIDLTFLGGNTPAERLYRRAGFTEVATIQDMFRIDGQSVHDVLMTKRIR